MTNDASSLFAADRSVRPLTHLWMAASTAFRHPPCLWPAGL